MGPEQKWEELRRHLEESVLWYLEQQANIKADHFYFFLKEGTTTDILTYMEYLDQPGRKPGEDINLSELLMQKTKAHHIRMVSETGSKDDNHT
jgi:hypothetical protein